MVSISQKMIVPPPAELNSHALKLPNLNYLPYFRMSSFLQLSCIACCFVCLSLIDPFRRNGHIILVLNQVALSKERELTLARTTSLEVSGIFVFR